jgi:hypothetical protein
MKLNEIENLISMDIGKEISGVKNAHLTRVKEQ